MTKEQVDERIASSQTSGITWQWLLVIFLVALTYRAVCFSSAAGDPLLTHPIVDAGYHDAWAHRIVNGDYFGHGPDDVFKPPLYPYFLAALYAVFGGSIHLVQWVQLVLGSLSCVFVAILAGRWLGSTTAKLAGLISALYAPAVFFELQLLTPTLSIFLNLTAMVLLTTQSAKRQPLRDVLVGAILALSVGVRPDVILPATMAIVYILYRTNASSPRRASIRLVRIAAAGLVVVLPIAIRNTHLTKTIIPISSNAGINFYVGNAPTTDGTQAVPVGLHWERLVAQVPQHVLTTPASASRWWTHKALQHIRANPTSALRRFARKAGAFLNRREFRNNIDYHFMQHRCRPMLISPAQIAVILPLALSGLLVLWRRWSAEARNACAVCGLWVIGYWMLGIIFFVTARFRIPAVPFLIVPAAWTLIRLAELIRSRQYRSLIVHALVILVIAAVVWPMAFGSPQHGWVRDYVNLGNSYRNAENLQAAEHAYRQALAIAPDDPDAHYLLARLLIRTSPSQALTHLDAARKVIPDSPDLMLTTAQTYLTIHKTQQARSILNDLIELSKTSNLWPKRAAWATAHIILADLEPDHAKTHWQRAWQIDPRSAAEASFLKHRNLNRVLDTFQTEAREKTWDWYSQANYAMILLELDRPNDAETQFRKAIRLAPERHGLKFHLARALLKSGKCADAATILEHLETTLSDCPLRRNVIQLRNTIPPRK